jgi:putative ABC transport system permease protein
MNLLRRLLTRRRLEDDLAEEIRQHLDEKTRELVACGLSYENARLAARRAFGNVTLLEEQGRDVWRWQLVDDALSDLRSALRQLRRSPSFAAAAVLTLALGIGANAAVFSIVRAVLLQPLPFNAPERLVSVQSQDIRGGPHPDSLDYPTFFDFRGAQIFERIVSYRDDERTISVGGVATSVPAQIVSWDLFQLLGVPLGLGRPFLAAEEQPGTRTVILSHDAWTTYFGGDPSLVGRTIDVDEEPHTVIGIAPAGFRFPMGGRRVAVWTTLARDADSDTVQPITQQRGSRMLNAIARLPRDKSLERAHMELDAVAARLAREYPNSNQSLPATYVVPELEHLVGDTRRPMLLLWGAVIVVLLAACANIAGMLLARTADRERELGIRLSIGGSRGRVIRQLLTENLVLAGIGCGAGLAVASLAIRGLLPLVADYIPRASAIELDASVVLFATGLAVATTALVSLPPALRVARFSFGESLHGAARTTTDPHDRFRSALVVAQVAAGLILLSTATLLGTGLAHLVRRDLGFRHEGLLSFQVSLPGTRYDTDRQVLFVGQLLERLRVTPGIAAAAGALPPPLAGDVMSVSFQIEGMPVKPGRRPGSDMAIVTPRYFAAIGAPVVAGREFTDGDDPHHPRVVLVNEAFAARFFPGRNALGKRIETGAMSKSDVGAVRPLWREIVGIVGNVRQAPLSGPPEPIYYLPFKQMPWSPPTLIVRTAGDPAPMEHDVRRVVAALDPQVPVHDAGTFEQRLSAGVAAPRFVVVVMESFAIIALLLTATGLYGILAYAVLRRTREIGVRMALGATQRAIGAMVVRRALMVVTAGIALGAVGAVAAQSLLRSVLAEIPVSGPAALAAAAAIVTITGIAAAYVPASRAARVDPSHALRTD